MIPSWLVWAEIECTVNVALPKQPIYQLKSNSANQQLTFRAYYYSIYYIVHDAGELDVGNLITLTRALDLMGFETGQAKLEQSNSAMRIN